MCNGPDTLRAPLLPNRQNIHAETVRNTVNFITRWQFSHAAVSTAVSTINSRWRRRRLWMLHCKYYCADDHITDTRNFFLSISLLLIWMYTFVCTFAIFGYKSSPHKTLTQTHMWWQVEETWDQLVKQIICFAVPSKTLNKSYGVQTQNLSSFFPTYDGVTIGR